MSLSTKSQTIKSKLIMLIIIVSALFISIFTLAGYFGVNTSLENEQQHYTDVNQELFKTIERRDTQMLKAGINYLAEIEDVKKAYLARDRETLYELTKPIFDKNKTSVGITHTYFIEPDGKVFLRVHDMDNYGDLVQRHSFLEAQETQQPSVGLERGKTAYALRVVAPYYYNNQLIGYLELAQEIDHFVNDLSSSTGSSYAVLGKKQYLNQPDYEAATTGSDLSWNNLNNYVILTKSSGIVAEGPCLTKGEVEIKTEPYTYKNFTDGKNSYSCTAIPLFDKSGTLKGGMIAKDNITPIYNSVYNLVKYVAVALLAILAIMVTILSTFANSNVIKPLQNISKAFNEIAKGNVRGGVVYARNDEIGQMVKSFNEMNEKLFDYQLNLEQKVKDQTADLNKFQMAVAGASDHIVITDNNGIILYANEAVHRITGYKPSEIIGKKAGSKNLWGGNMELGLYKKLWKTIKVDKKPFSGVFHNIRKNGKQYEAAADVTPILDEKGNVMYFIGIERDVTKEKEVDQAKTEFVSLASHQLRTPLSAINWYTEMLINGDAGKLNKEQASYLDEIYKGNQRMVDLVNSLLNVSRLELGTFEIRPEPVDLKETVKDVVKELSSQLTLKRQTLAEKYSAKLPKAKVDRRLMRIIIQNLLSNAVKYTPNGGKIGVEVSYGSLGYRITVSDTGYGVPRDQQDKLFTKLFRADNVRSMDTEGTGLGLYIIKSILESGGGKISFKSTLNKGTTFTVQLPKSGMKAKAGSKSLD